MNNIKIFLQRKYRNKLNFYKDKKKYTKNDPK